MKKLFKTPKITQRIIRSAIILGFILASSITLIGYSQFTRIFTVQYNNYIMSIAQTARACLEPDKIEQYYATNQKDEAYEKVEKILIDLTEKFDLTFSYVSYVEAPDYTKIHYIFDTVNSKSKWTPYELGYTENYTEENYNKSAKAVFEAGTPSVRHTFKTRSGSHITAMVPVTNSQRKIVAVLGVQKSMQEFVNARRHYLLITTIAEIIIAILFIIVITAASDHSIIKPLMEITKEAGRFAEENKTAPGWIEKIKNKDEIKTLARSVEKMEDEIIAYIENLTSVTAEKERISTELNVAHQIQADMLPSLYPAFPARKDFDLFASMTPAKEVGGDLYDYLLLDKDHLMLVVGDVSGKGVPASLFMVITKTLLSSHAIQNMSPKQIFETTNSQLCQNNETGMFVTCWLGILTISTGKLTFVNAGHPDPIWYHDGEFKPVVTKPNLVLAALPQTVYKEHTITMNRGDRLFIYTDGVSEATDADNNLYGDERILKTLPETLSMNTHESIGYMKKSIDDFTGSAPQFDDITMMELILDTPIA